MTPEAAKRRAAQLRERAAQLIAEAEVFEQLATSLAGLHSGSQSGSLAEMHLEHRNAISASRGDSSPLKTAALKAGLSLRALGEQIGVSHVHLSNVASGKKPLSEDLAARLRAVIGWPKK